MNRIVHFEIHAEKPERAMDFYKTVFDWSFEKYEGMDQDYWGIMTAEKDSKEPGINGGLLFRDGSVCPPNSSPNAFVCTVAVSDIDQTIIAIEKAGGRLAMPKFAIPGMAWQAYYTDTEGNIFGIHEADKEAR